MKIRVLLLSAAFCALAAEAGSFTALTAGNTEVVADARCHETTAFAAQEATNFLSRVFGRSVPLVRRPTSGKISVIIGENEWSRAAGLDPARLPRDGFIVRAEPGRVYLCGVDERLSGFLRAMNGGDWAGSLNRHRRASLFAVYEFLEAYAGCRFYFPGAGEIVPRSDVVRVPHGERVHAPDVPVRKYYITETFAGRPTRWIGGDGKSLRIGLRRNWMRLRMTTFEIPFCHGLVQNDYLGRFKTSHPEYFALKENGSRFTGYDGYESSRHGMLCFSSGVTNEIYRDAKAYLTGADPATRRCAKDGKGRWTWPCSMLYGRYVDIMPNDSQYRCRCEACAKRYGTGDSYLTPVVWGYTRDIAQRLLDEGVSGYVTQMAYSHYGDPPAFDLPTNVLVMVAKVGPFGVRDAASHARDVAAIRAWRRKTGGVHTWTYPNKYGSLAVRGIPTVTPRAWARFYKETAPLTDGAFAESECDSFFYNHLNYYVFSKILWDTDTDVEALLDEYYRLMYGRAADAARKYFEALEDTFLDKVVGEYENTPGGPVARAPGVHRLWTEIYSPAVLDAWDRLLDEGASRLSPGSAEAERFALMRRETQDLLRRESRAYLAVADASVHLAKLRKSPPTRDALAGCLDRFRACTFDKEVRLVGEASLRIVAEKEKDVAQALLFLDGRDGPVLKPDTRYRLSYFVKGENIVPTGRTGGISSIVMDAYNRFLPATADLNGTFDWVHRSFEFKTHPETNVRAASYLRVGIRGASGTAWFDGLRLEEIPDQVAVPGRTAIVVDSRAPDATLFAAKELKKFLERRFGGKEVPIMREAREGWFSFVLGTNRWSVAAGLRPEKLPRDSFIVRSAPGRLYVCGCDEAGGQLSAEVEAGMLSQSERATLFGVYDVLERYAGCRFYFPGELGECVPRGADLPIPALDRVESPDYTVRRIYDGYNNAWFDGDGKRGMVMNRLRTRMETETIPCCHGLNAFRYLKRFGKSNPEYFALSQGIRQVDPGYKHAGQICWSSGIMEEVYKDARSYLKGEGPEVRGIPKMKGEGFAWNYNCAGRRYVDVMPQDAMMPCDCPPCKEALAKGPRESDATDLVWNRIAEWGRRLKAEGIPGDLTMMSYKPFECVPAVDIPDNVQVMLAVTGPFGLNDPDGTAKDDERIRAWTRKLGHKVWLWTYPNKYGPLNIKGVPQFSMRAWGRYYRERSDLVFGAFAESESDRWFYNHLNYYVFGRIMWNLGDNVERILTEYTYRMFGRTAAAYYMGRVLTRLEDKWMKEICGRVVKTNLGPQVTPPDDEGIWTKVYSPAFLEELDRTFTAAEKAAAGGEDADLVLRRIALYRQEILRPLRERSEAYLSLRRAVDAQPRIREKETVKLVPYKSEARDLPGARASVWKTQTHLCARFTCDEPRMGDILAVKRERDEHFIWQDNNVEFFFCPTGDRRLYYHIIVNSEGSLSDARRRLIGKKSVSQKDWNPDLRLSVRKEKDSWTCDIAVPLSSIEPLAEAMPVCFGRSRVHRTGGPKVKYFTSSPLSPTWSAPACYPLVEFGKVEK